MPLRLLFFSVILPSFFSLPSVLLRLLSFLSLLLFLLLLVVQRLHPAVLPLILFFWADLPLLAVSLFLSVSFLSVVLLRLFAVLPLGLLPLDLFPLLLCVSCCPLLLPLLLLGLLCVAFLLWVWGSHCPGFLARGQSSLPSFLFFLPSILLLIFLGLMHPTGCCRLFRLCPSRSC